MQLMENAYWVPLLPLIAAAVIVLFGKLMPWKGAEVGIAAVGVAWVISIGLAWHTLFNAPVEPIEHAVVWAPLGGGFHFELGMLVDGLTSMMFLLVTTVSLMAQIYSREYMKGEVRFTYFYAMLSLFTFSMLLLVISNNLLIAVVGWELVGVCSYLLIGFYWEEKPNQDAGNKAFLVTKFADIGLITGVIVLSSAFAQTGVGDPFNIRAIIDAATSGALPHGRIVLGTLLIFLGAVGKSGQFPLHVWLPDAMAGPTPVSALIHAATMVTAGVFFIARLYPIFAQSAGVMHTIAVVGTITLFVAGFLAMVQDDVKKVLAYSTVSQLGYMIAALGVGGYTAGIFHLFTHGFFKALLFLGAGSLIHSVHSNNMSDMGGLRAKMPTTFWTFVIGSLALAGFPLTAGFFSKDEILVTAQHWGGQGFVTGPLVYWLGLAAAGVTTFYMGRAVFLIFFGETRAHGHPHESGRWILVPLVTLAVLSIAAGYLGSPWWPKDSNFEQWTATETLEQQAYPFLSTQAEGATAPSETGEGMLVGPPTFHLDVALEALAVFLAAAALAWRWYGDGLPERDPTFQMGGFSTALERKLWIDDLGYALVVAPVRDRLAPATYTSNQRGIDAVVNWVGGTVRRIATTTYTTVDQQVIDGGINGAAFSAAWWSSKLKRIQSGNVQRYAATLVAGVVVLVLVFAGAR